MQISGNTSMGVINNLSSAQTKSTVDTADSLATAAAQAKASKDDAKLKATCKDLEAVFLNIMMTEMRKTVDKSKLVDSSKEDIMTSMLDTEMTKNMAKAGGIGLGDMIYRQLTIAASATKKSQALK